MKLEEERSFYSGCTLHKIDRDLILALHLAWAVLGFQLLNDSNRGNLLML